MGTEVNKQQGAALVIVMVLLASALVMALIGMQAALVDERLAGNFRASIQAQMRAETAASEALVGWDELDWQGAPVLETPKATRFDDVGTYSNASVSHRCPHQSCFYMPIIYHGERWVMALGATFDGNGALIAQSLPLLVARKASGDADAEEAVVWQ